MQPAVAHGRHPGPAFARGHGLRPELLAAPGTDDEVGRAARRLQRVGDDAVAAQAHHRALGEDIVAPGGGDQLAHPLDGADHGLVPLLEVDARPARPGCCHGGDLRVARQAVGDPGLGPRLRPHQAGDQAHRVENLRHAALVGDEHVQPGPDELVGQRGLHVREADHQVGLQRHDAVDLAVQEGADPGLLVARPARPHGVAADAHDAVIFTQQVEPLGGLLGQADDALGAGAVHSCIVPAGAPAEPLADGGPAGPGACSPVKAWAPRPSAGRRPPARPAR